MKKDTRIIDPDDPILRFVDEISALSKKVPFSTLKPGEAPTLGAYLYADGPLLAEAVALALTSQPRFFPGLLPRGEALARDLGRAVLWDVVIARLELLLKQARESQVHDQGRVVKAAIDLMERIDLEDKLWWTGVTDEQRRDPAWRREELVRHLLRQVALMRAHRLMQERRDMARTGKGKGKGKPRPRGTAPGRAMARSEIEEEFLKGLKKK